MQDGDRRKFRLLLLSSCCSELSATIRDQVRRQDPSVDKKSGITLRPEYRQTFYQDRNCGDNGRGRPTLCGPEHERDAWGLLIYSAARPDTYYRVGTFLSRALLGDLGIFDRGYTDTVTLV